MEFRTRAFIKLYRYLLLPCQMKYRVYERVKRAEDILKNLPLYIASGCIGNSEYYLVNLIKIQNTSALKKKICGSQGAKLKIALISIKSARTLGDIRY